MIDLISKALDLAGRVFDFFAGRETRKPTEPDAIPVEVRQSVSAGEAARRASHGPFKR